jgi:hypothetical protein
MPISKKTKALKKSSVQHGEQIKVSIVKNKPATMISVKPVPGISEISLKSPQKARTKIRIFDEETKEVKEGSQKKENTEKKMPLIKNQTISENRNSTVKDEKIKHHIQKNEVIDLTKKIDPKLTSKTSEVKQPAFASEHKSLGLYKRIAFVFVILVAILLGIIFYTSFVKVKISLIPNQEKVTSNVILDIYDKVKNANTANASGVSGIIGNLVISETKTYPTTGEKPLNEEVNGKVTIYNNYYKNQPLVASTRLLSSDGKLFRTKSTVNVPAGGSVDVEVYADNPADLISLPPTRFTLPALWAGLQDKIYAESKAEMAKGSQVKHFVTQADIDGAIKDLRDALIKKAKDQVVGKEKDYDQVLYLVDEASMSSTIDSNLNDGKESISGTMSANVDYVFFSSKDANEVIRAKFGSSIPKEKEIVIFDDKSVKYSLNECSAANGTASINTTFEGKISMKNEAEILDRQKIIGLTKNQLEDYIKKIPEIASYDIQFTPSFVKRVPNLVDRINIEVKK